MGVALAGIQHTVFKKALAGPLPFKEQSLCWMDKKKLTLAETSPYQYFLKRKLLACPANKIPVTS